jgi:hypothetical protein
MIDHATPTIEGTGDDVPQGGGAPPSASHSRLPRLLALSALFGVGITGR